MNATLQKFGYPGTTVWAGKHWVVLLRPQQVTLGALVLASLSDAQCFSDLGSEALQEHGVALQRCERGLKAFRPYDKINALTLMMVDPHVHSHVLPRYAAPQSFEGVSFPDVGWPGVPDLKSATALSDHVRARLHDGLKAAFSAGQAI